MSDHRRVFPVLAPNPSFRDVVCIVKMQSEFVLVTGRGRREVCCAFKLKDEFLGVGRRRNSSHARLIVGWAVVNERDGVSVHMIEGDHLFHAGHGEGLHDGGIGYDELESGFDLHAMVVGSAPLSCKRLHLLERNFGVGCGNSRSANEETECNLSCSGKKSHVDSSLTRQVLGHSKWNGLAVSM